MPTMATAPPVQVLVIRVAMAMLVPEEEEGTVQETVTDIQEEHRPRATTTDTTAIVVVVPKTLFRRLHLQNLRLPQVPILH
jgi:hypothetical protein